MRVFSFGCDDSGILKGTLLISTPLLWRQCQPQSFAQSKPIFSSLNNKRQVTGPLKWLRQSCVLCSVVINTFILIFVPVLGPVLISNTGQTSCVKFCIFIYSNKYEISATKRLLCHIRCSPDTASAAGGISSLLHYCPEDGSWLCNLLCEYALYYTS